MQECWPSLHLEGLGWYGVSKLGTTIFFAPISLGIFRLRLGRYAEGKKVWLSDVQCSDSRQKSLCYWEGHVFQLSERVRLHRQ